MIRPANHHFPYDGCVAADLVADAQLVVAFLNTFDVETRTDELTTQEAWASWSAARRLPPAGPLSTARAARHALPRRPPTTTTPTPAGSPSMSSSGSSTACPQTVAQDAAAAVLAAAARVAEAGRWSRVKLCAAETCRWAFVDESRNRSRTWCSMDGLREPGEGALVPGAERISHSDRPGPLLPSTPAPTSIGARQNLHRPFNSCPPSKAARPCPTPSPPRPPPPPTSGFGTFDEEGNYTPREVAVDDLGMSFADAIDGTMVEVEDGQLVNGTIVKIDKDEVLLDIGYKSEGVIPSRELSIRNDVDPHEIVSLGEKVEALVLQKEDKEGRLLLSKKRAQYERAWGTIEKLKEEDGVVEGPVIEVVKGGLIVDIGLRGFLPASLVELRRVRDLQPYVGQRISAKIIELDKNRNNVVLSRRAHLEETQKESRDQFLNNLKVGEVRHGTVSSVVSFGAFVDLGGMDGLIHVSELSWKHVDHPGSVVAVGDEVDVQVLDVDMSRERISLSLKATQQDPWQEFAGGHEVGQLVYGRVTKLVQFGAFVQVGDGIEGLVHISEMSTHHVDSPDQVVTPGEELWVKIIDLDLARRRISLSIKQAAEGGELAEEYREHFEVDEHGNWTAGDTDAEREAAWSEYYGEDGPAGRGGVRERSVEGDVVVPTTRPATRSGRGESRSPPTTARE